MQAAYGVPLASLAVVRSDATGEGIIRWCGAARLTCNILAWMAVVTYSLLTLALIKISKVGGSQHFGDGLEWRFAPQWSAKVEYLCVDLGGGRIIKKKNNNDHSLTENIFRIGINYHFHFY